MSDELAVAKKNNGHGGARPGAGRPPSSALLRREQQLQRYRGVRLCRKAIERLTEILFNDEIAVKDPQAMIRAIIETLDRFGHPRRSQVDAMVEAPAERGDALSPEAVDRAVEVLMLYKAGQVQAIDVPYEESVPAGNGEPSAAA